MSPLVFMGELVIKKNPRAYSFNINGVGFQVIVHPWSNEGKHPIDILITELKEVVATLERQRDTVTDNRKEFKLPPVVPELYKPKDPKKDEKK